MIDITPVLVVMLVLVLFAASRKHKAIITGGTLFPDCEILEQDRVAFAD